MRWGSAEGERGGSERSGVYQSKGCGRVGGRAQDTPKGRLGGLEDALVFVPQVVSLHEGVWLSSAASPSGLIWHLIRQMGVFVCVCGGGGTCRALPEAYCGTVMF